LGINLMLQPAIMDFDAVDITSDASTMESATMRPSRAGSGSSSVDVTAMPTEICRATGLYPIDTHQNDEDCGNKEQTNSIESQRVSCRNQSGDAAFSGSNIGCGAN